MTEVETNSQEQKPQEGEPSKQNNTLQITMGEINDKNINLLRKLNFFTFPVKYSTSLYMKIMTEYAKHSKFAYYNDIVIGAYTTRLQEFRNAEHAYILTFGVLEPYRKYGVGKQMMKELEKDITDNTKAEGIYLHMHVLNEGGKKFYEKCGFEVSEKLENYYTDLEEPHCYILLKKIDRSKNSA